MFKPQQSQCVLKKNQYRVEIRRLNLSKILSLKRIKPKLVESDSDALCILTEGIDHLKSTDTTEEITLTVLKSIADTLKKYQFDTHKRLIDNIIILAKSFFAIDSMQREIVKEAALELLMVLCFNQRYGITYDKIPFEVLNGFNLQMIKYCLVALAQLLLHFDYSQFSNLKGLFNDIQIFKKLLTILANFYKSPQCFETIKIPFMSLAVTLCFLNFNCNINLVQNDFRQLVGFCTDYIENDIIYESQKDETLKVFFGRYYQAQKIQEIYQKTTQFAYPFMEYQMIIGMVNEVNPNVVLKLKQCLSFQIRAMSVQQPLMRCLVKVFNNTQQCLEGDLRQEVFGYIFALQYAQQDEETNGLCMMVLLAINDFMNYQMMDDSIFNYMGDPMNEMYPRTCHLLEVMEYLQIRKDYFTQEKLLELVDHYLTICGSYKIIDECVDQLLKFKTGCDWLKKKDYFQEGIQGREYVVDNFQWDRQYEI